MLWTAIIGSPRRSNQRRQLVFDFIVPRSARRDMINGMKRDETVRTINAQYVCTFRPEPEGGYTVRCSAFPEVVSYGATLQEARHNAREALELCIEVYQEKGWERRTNF
jgi:predicted RNase H-like HicB family nuclease